MIRESYEKKEQAFLSDKATLCSNSKGRTFNEPPCPIRTCYQRDRDRILHSKSFRRLKDKTQVFLSPEGDHYRTRLTHTLEVAQISRTIARALNLNEDLTEAIALGHDLGHTPFGHCGEEALNEVHKEGFKHNTQSLRVVNYLEEKSDHFRGLNLTYEVKNGILNHTGPKQPETLEGEIVKLSDRIAYINHDIDDAIRAGIFSPEDIPEYFQNVFGYSYKKWLNIIILDVINSSRDLDTIKMSKDFNKVFLELREFMFENVYLNEKAKYEETKARHVVEFLYRYFQNNPAKMAENYYEIYLSEGDIGVKDFIASMSDKYALYVYNDKFVPKFWLY